MRTQYTCIGGFIDLDDLSLIRFDLDGDKFKILCSKSIGYMPPLLEIPKLILQLAAVSDDIAIAQIDLLTNFDSAHIPWYHVFTKHNSAGELPKFT